MGMRVASTAATNGPPPRWKACTRSSALPLLGVGGFRGRPQFVLLRLRSNYDARLPPGGFAGVFPLPWFAKGEA
jgi:hypothetical protein